MKVRIRVASPAPVDSRWGNRITALRWEEMFRRLGYRISSGNADVMVALHALKSLPQMREFRLRCPSCPLILVLTGTDIYGDQPWQESLELADRIVVLQSRALETIPQAYLSRARVIVQAGSAPLHPPGKLQGTFRFLVVGHLRSVKDPLLAARASRNLPETSKIEVVLLGQAIDPELALLARQEEAHNRRFRWVGERPRGVVLRMLAASQGLILSSRSKGGPAVLSEAICCGVPVLASDIPGAQGILGNDYKGFFPVAGADDLARLMVACENDPTYYQTLVHQIKALQPMVDSARERGLWEALLADLS